MKLVRSSFGLTPPESRARLLAICGIVAALLVLRAVDPHAMSWLAIGRSCGAITGLPCIFCGTTRALHYLLNGDFAGALYFNWLSFPITFTVLVILLLFALEAVLDRRMLKIPFAFRLTPQRVAAAVSGITALWLFQVALAVGLQKRELFNPAGFLYAFLVR